ncbi:PEP-CTERM sorting domain-containing protein [Aquabacterium sp. OR-4]|uniref:PEP-CTERM sorting domain-containing protein n=1 Tax=Aquabacterium sp. OR-4 TaxID=2978127 RepID=UPI0021B2A804|nr:PEP-CTERM sorting domain-containing protein [Aquabacterium sp. OR-4]MDT7834455.1 hypothetical protein [Aquabacterium sp. OR-4]
MNSRRPQGLLSGLCAAAASVALAAPAQAEQHYAFDTGVQGWTASGGLLSHVDGGAAGQWLHVLDNDGSTDMVLHFPSLGDWSAYLGGTLSFDARNASQLAADWPEFGQVTLVSGGTTLGPADRIAPGEPPADGQWHHYRIALTPAVFGAALPTVMGNLTAASFKVEYHATFGTDFEAIDIDNIRLSAAVPEPAAWQLLLAGGLLAGLAGLARRH